MKVLLSNQQFEALLKAVYLADWMVNGIREPGDEVRDLADLKQHLWSLAHKVGFATVVEYEPKLAQVVATDEFEEPLHRLIDDYDDMAFWDGLVDRLAYRDFVEKHGVGVKRMDPEEHFLKFSPVVDKYESEFEKHGVDRLRIVGKRRS